ncbi:uncharacterized protein LOC110050771 [Orbicella faveolata]|uniref:uncharacterized protein LOC110050771 n=1 Tax=Orbicella faveolata TaxID=48498 RepID=UPI0009E44CE0|nr:uncharacterized protein LOC110050771 [Orbicella faveolata]
MSVFRFGRSLVRSFCKQFTDKGSGKVAAKSGLGSGGEIRESHRASARQLVVASRASQNASLFGRLLWRGFTSAVSVTQAASLRRMAVSRFLRGCGPKAPVFAFLGFAYASKQPVQFNLHTTTYINQNVGQLLWNSRYILQVAGCRLRCNYNCKTAGT